MTKAFAWIKKYGWTVLAGLGAVIVAVLGIRHEARKVRELKCRAARARLEKDAANHEVREQVHLEREAVLKEQEDKVDGNISRRLGEIKESRERIAKLPAPHVADGFNSLYRDTE